MSKKKKKRKVIQKPDEVLEYGPIRLERYGRFLQQTSMMTEQGAKKYRERLKASQPELRENINSTITRLIEIAEQYDPFQLLSTVSIKNVFGDPEEYRESTNEGHENYIEFAQSLITGLDKLGIGNDPPNEIIEEFHSLIEKLYSQVMWFFISQGADSEEESFSQRLRFSLLMQFLFGRGASFQEHHIEMIADLFEPHDTFLKKNFGLTTNQIIESYKQIENQITQKIHLNGEFVYKMKEAHKSFVKWTDSIDQSQFSSMEEVMGEFQKSQGMQENRKELQELADKTAIHPFLIEQSDEVPNNFLDLLSMDFGENSGFVQFDRAPGWPTNDSIIYDKPLIKHEGNYYCFAPVVLFRNLGRILESWILNASKNYFDNNYEKKRADYLEQKALEYLEKLLTGAEVYGKLYYEVEEDGIEKRAETDGIVIFDNNLFIIEAKAGAFSLSAKRGGLKRVRSDLKEIMDKAYTQAVRTKKYVTETNVPRFEFENGSEALVIRDKDDLDNIFLVNVTYESLNHIATSLNSIRGLDLIQGSEWPWSVFINDLRTISEILDSPTEFLVYLNRRLRANEFPKFETSDELDFLMYYIRHGLYLEDAIPDDLTRLSPHGYTEDLDRYYDFLGGRVSTGEKPKMNIPDESREFIREIEAIGQNGFTRITTAILDMDYDMQKQFIQQIVSAAKKTQSERKRHDFSIHSPKSNRGITVSTRPLKGTSNGIPVDLDDFCKGKMYLTKFSNWILLIVNVDGSGERSYTFKCYKQEWKPDATMEKKVKAFKENKWRGSGIDKSKVGRNDSCPCGSGQKFKKCCINLKV